MKRTFLLTIAVILSCITFAQVAHTSSVTIDNVYGGVWDDGGTIKLFPNEEIHFDVRFTNNSGIDYPSFSTGFRVWTTGGTPFTPLNAELVYPGFADLFDIIFNAQVFSADGVGADTLSIGGAALFESGIYNGFNEIVLKLSTGGIQEGETLCIDSSFFPPSGQWLWSSGSGDIVPSWSGQQCFTAECAGGLLVFDNCIDTIKNTNGDSLFYDFDAHGFIPSFAKFVIIDGPGTIDSLTGEWSYDITPSDIGTIDNLIIGAYQFSTCLTFDCYTTLDFTCNIPADMNNNCSVDISDLVLLVAYMFQGGSSPTPLLSADMNGDSNIDISDLVYLIAYMFQGGPPPVG